MHRIMIGLRGCVQPAGWVLLAISLAACGGGGSKGGESSGLSYSGVRDQATITSTNADRLVGVLVGTYFGQSGSAPAPQGAATSLSTLQTGDITRKLIGATLPRSDRLHISAQQNINFPIDGECGGRAVYQGSYDDQSGVFQGSTVFTGFCEAGETLDGTMRVSGTVQLPVVGFPVFLSMTMSYDLLTIKIAMDTYALSGSTSWVMLPPGTDGFTQLDEYVETLNVRKNTNPVVRIENYTTRVAEGVPAVGTDTIRVVSGRIYSPPDGYVDVSSTSNFLIRDTDDYPYAGVMAAVGKTAVGGVGPSRAVVTANSDALTFRLQVDANGDGVYEIDQVRNWADF